jgi:hypothetical protein
VASRSLGQVEAYFTVLETLFLAKAQMACSGASLTVLAGNRFATLGLILALPMDRLVALAALSTQGMS